MIDKIFARTYAWRRATRQVVIKHLVSGGVGDVYLRPWATCFPSVIVRVSSFSSSYHSGGSCRCFIHICDSARRQTLCRRQCPGIFHSFHYYFSLLLFWEKPTARRLLQAVTVVFYIDPCWSHELPAALFLITVCYCLSLEISE